MNNCGEKFDLKYENLWLKLEIEDIVNKVDSFMSSGPQIVKEDADGVTYFSKVQKSVPDPVRHLYNMATNHATENRFQEAIPFCKDIVRAMEREECHELDLVVTILTIYGYANRDEDNLQEAAYFLEKALTAQNRILDEDSPSISSTLNDLAVVYGLQKNYLLAEHHCKRALGILERLWGENSFDVAQQLENLALLYRNQAKYGQAEICLEKSLKLYLIKRNYSHAITARKKLMTCYIKQGKHAEAEILFTTSEEIIKSDPNFHDPGGSSRVCYI